MSKVTYVMPHLVKEGDRVVIEQFGYQWDAGVVVSAPKSDGYIVSIDVLFGGEARVLRTDTNRPIAVIGA